MTEKLQITMSLEQLEQFVTTIIEQTLDNYAAKQQAEPAKRYVYGIKGIADLFRVSPATAQQYKNTFLAPAIQQRGRKIITDAEMAISLYGQAKGIS